MVRTACADLLVERREQQLGAGHVVEADQGEIARRIGGLLDQTRDAAVLHLGDAETPRVVHLLDSEHHLGPAQEHREVGVDDRVSQHDHDGTFRDGRAREEYGVTETEPFLLLDELDGDAVTLET